MGFRILPIVVLVGLLSCAKKVPPPGKGEFRGPKLLLFSPESGDTVRDTLKIYVYAEDPSGLSAFTVRKGRQVLATFPVKGKSYSLDTFLILPRTGDTLLPDTVEIGATDRWDNWSGIKVEVFTYRKATGTKDSDKDAGK